MRNIRPFQLVLMGIFGLLAVGAVFFVMTYNGGNNTEDQPYGKEIMIWGTLSANGFNGVKSELVSSDENLKVINYRQYDEDQFDAELLDAIAEGNPPDLIIMPHDSLVKHRAKLRPITYKTYSERQFRDTYIDGAEIFMMSDGIYGLPIVVDPMVMFWNRDIFSSSGLTTPPTTWEALVSVTTPLITKLSGLRDIEQSAVAFGEYTNVTHAKDILAMLFLQSGTTIVEESASGDYQITVNRSTGSSLPPGDAALSYYTQFGTPSDDSYTWSRALPSDWSRFISGDLGLYFGFGSEIRALEEQNPNLNFDVARVPQGGDATTLRNFGRFYAFAFPKASTKNIQGALNVAYKMSEPSAAGKLAAAFEMAPVHRSLMGTQTGVYQTVINQSAIIARGWLDPDPVRSDTIFRQMIEDVTSGRNRSTQAIMDAAGRLQLLF